jgi:hypothetical protein
MLKFKRERKRERELKRGPLRDAQSHGPNAQRKGGVGADEYGSTRRREILLIGGKIELVLCA